MHQTVTDHFVYWQSKIQIYAIITEWLIFTAIVKQTSRRRRSPLIRTMPLTNSSSVSVIDLSVSISLKQKQKYIVGLENTKNTQYPQIKTLNCLIHTKYEVFNWLCICRCIIVTEPFLSSVPASYILWRIIIQRVKCNTSRIMIF